MNALILLVQQIITMFLYMAVGIWLYRTQKITRKGSGEIASMLVWLIIPVVVIKSYCVEPTPDRMRGLGWSTVCAVILLAAAIALARLFFSKRPIDHFAAAFSNAGFIGIPLVSAVLGEEAVFYIAPFIAILNILQWTYGVAVMTGQRIRVQKDLFLNPLVISWIFGMVLFFTGFGVELPSVVSGAISGLAGLNAPMAMLVLGVYFAQSNFSTLFSDFNLYKVSLIRLVVIPLASLLILKVLPVPSDIALAIAVCAATPVGANVAVYAQIHQLEYVYASKTVVFSTVFSVMSIPLLLLLGQRIL